MKAEYESLEVRLHKERLDFFKKVSFQRKCEKQIDFVVDNKWLQNQEKAYLTCEVSNWIFPSFKISISNVLIDEFIENILGPFHIEFDLWWRMELTGDENDPVFIFKPIRSYDNPIEFRIKEGEFKVCKFRKKFIELTKPQESQPIFGLEMICE